MAEYINRVCDGELAFRLGSKGAVLVEGPKWCGKTTTALQRAASVLYMQDPAARRQNQRLAEIDPGRLLEGAAPRLLDEWQLAPVLWDAVRFEVDRRSAFGQFVLTGSAAPVAPGRRMHTGTGRIARMRMRTMSLFESGESSGALSLGGLFDSRGGSVERASLDIGDIAFLVCRGGWPAAAGALAPSDAVALQQAADYLDAVVESDVAEVDGVGRDPHLARAVLRSYARMTASQGTMSRIVADVSGGVPASRSTVERYLRALRSIYVVEDLEAWNPNLRSKTAVRTSPTRHLADPSIAAAALGAGPQDLVNDLSTLGLLFESMCVRDLRVYAQSLGGEVRHYRDRSGLECDAVVHLRDGRYGLVEVKLGGDALVEEGAASLLKLAGRIDTASMPAPSFLMVLTGVGDFSYPREDGVLVAPIGCLGP